MDIRGHARLDGSPLKGFHLEADAVPARDRYTDLYLFGKVTGLLDGTALGEPQNHSLLRLYRDQGISFVENLEGYYFIIIADRRDGALYLVNNRYSNTRLYYSAEGGVLHFSSVFRNLASLSQARPNMKTINLFLNSGYSYSRETFIEGIRRLVPGYYLKVKDGVEEIRYSRMSFDRRPVTDLRKAQDEYVVIWRDEISSYLKANAVKEVGSALSGGVDTSFVVLNASAAHKRSVHTYTAEYDYTLFNESKKAEHVTKVCKGKHHVVKIGSDALDLLPEMIHASEEPILASSLSLYCIMREASKDVQVFMTGDGGNNIFNHLYPVCEIHRYIRHLPYPLRNALYHSVDYLSRAAGSERLWELKYPLHAFRGRDFYRNFYRELTCYRHFSSEERKRLFRKGFYGELDESDDPSIIRISDGSFCNSLIEARFLHGSMQYVSTFHEKFADSFGMLLFPPYQNMRVIRFLNSLPFSLLNEGNTFERLTNKALRMPFQKDILARHFGKEHAYGCGQPFDQPFHGWLMEKPAIVDSLFRRLAGRGWYEKSYLDSLYREHRRQTMHKKIYCQLKNHAYRIMALLALEVWCMQFLDGIGPQEGLQGFLEASG